MTLEEWRSLKSLTYRQLALLLELDGVAPARTVQRYAKGERTPRSAIMQKIITLTDGAVTPNDFIPLSVDKIHRDLAPAAGDAPRDSPLRSAGHAAPSKPEAQKNAQGAVE